MDDRSVGGLRGGERSEGGAGGQRESRGLTLAELFDEDRLEVMSCRYKDYDPVRLAESGGDWLEEEPNPSLSPKAVSILTFFLNMFRDDAGDAGGGGGVVAIVIVVSIVGFHQNLLWFYHFFYHTIDRRKSCLVKEVFPRNDFYRGPFFVDSVLPRMANSYGMQSMRNLPPPRRAHPYWSSFIFADKCI